MIIKKNNNNKITGTQTVFNNIIVIMTFQEPNSTTLNKL